MLELVAQSVSQRGSSGSSRRTGAGDLLGEFGLTRFYDLVMRQPVADKNYITISTREVPTGLPGDTSLFMDPAWSLLRPPRHPSAPTEPTERVAERLRRGFRFAPGAAVLAPADKGVDVTRVFMRNVSAAGGAPPRPAAVGGGGASSGGGAGGGGSSMGAPVSKRGRVAAGAASPDHGHTHSQAASGDTATYSHDSKRQRSNY
ncbi:hypothetical protein CHLRE_10g454800v5 [Chlamydomonas reinhardtii]|uniref:Uncharacterized protein n=1 Tax=Chlamydomonas reinhardtii TaxID=3055 RepID=A0A2K3DBG3_CHLRE|nr:uncharacterized protein CHLRE_10g454800v5 [Chlamydomonas reinhardtii]PNW77863.1 hypothetical protein CHLRE_10g454800v5 [Chlamydomonas reinhardtii]